MQTNGFVYALIEREFTKTGEPIIKVGMSRKCNPADRLRGYPRGSFYIWVRHTPSPVRDERLILATMRIWFKDRRDIGAEYFEGDQNVVTGLLSALMQARESMRSNDTDPDDTDMVDADMVDADHIKDEKGSKGSTKAAVPDTVAMFDAFAAAYAIEFHCSVMPCETLHEKFATYVRDNHGIKELRVGYSWIEKQAKGRLGATVRPRMNKVTLTTCPMIVFPPMIFDASRSIAKPNPLFVPSSAPFTDFACARAWG